MEKILTVDEVIAATSGSAPMHIKKRKRLEKLTNEQLISYQLRTKLVNACRVKNKMLCSPVYIYLIYIL